VDYLTDNQINQLIQASKGSNHGYRNSTAILLAFRHGLRSIELLNLEWRDIDLDGGRIYIRRAKGSKSGYHPLRGDEIRRLRRLQRESKSSLVFISQKGSPLTTRGFRYIVGSLGEKAGLGKIHPHILRHSCGYHLANQGLDTRLIQDYLGHVEISNTVVYTKTNPERFKEIQW